MTALVGMAITIDPATNRASASLSFDRASAGELIVGAEILLREAAGLLDGEQPSGVPNAAAMAARIAAARRAIAIDTPFQGDVQ